MVCLCQSIHHSAPTKIPAIKNKKFCILTHAKRIHSVASRIFVLEGKLMGDRGGVAGLLTKVMDSRFQGNPDLKLIKIK